MSERASQPEHNYTAEQIAQANAGDTLGLIIKYIEDRGSFFEPGDHPTDEGYAETHAAQNRLSHLAEQDAARVEQGVGNMYEEAYAEND